jgi:ABC-type multidrug transport system ATPase subunit
MPRVIDVQHLSKSFGNYSILEELSLCVNDGEVYGLVGLNGAGKTTLIRLLLGVLKPDGGALSVLGLDPWQHDAAPYRRMGVVLEHDGFWGNLTFEQNMKIFAAAKGIAWSDAARYIEGSWSNTDLYKNKKAVKYFSRGQRMQCALCRAFLGSPALFLFDEPAVALDVGAYDHFRELVAAARGRGAAFLISSHQLDAIDDLADRVGMLHDKRLAELSPATGRPDLGGCWAIATDRSEAWAAIITSECGSEPLYEDGEWRFAVPDAAKTIPLLVTRLVAAGCSIGKVAPRESGFGELVRSEYRRKFPAKNPAAGREGRAS